MEEEYKVIEAFNNYEISNLGNVRNIKTGHILKPALSGGNYYTVALWKSNIGKSVGIHRLVSESFIPNPDNKKYVDHIDRNKTNNRIENLRWCSQNENMMNVGIKKNNTSTYTGVHYNKSKNKWQVKIHINGKQKHIGYFNNFDEAVTNRKEQEEIYYKEFRANN